MSYPIIGELLKEMGYSLQANQKVMEGSNNPDRNEQFKFISDFIDKKLGRANPYGVYDIGSNTGWVSVGTDHDTAGFAVETIRRWWNTMGKQRYPTASELLITADGGGSNGSRVRLWKLELQRLADEIKIPIIVSHLPPRNE